jgi:hypothetical protein
MPSRLIEYVVSDQKRGDVVSNGDHCGIAVSATESIAAGKEKASQFPLLYTLNCFAGLKAVCCFQVYKATTAKDITPTTIQRYVG